MKALKIILWLSILFIGVVVIASRLTYVEEVNARPEPPPTVIYKNDTYAEAPLPPDAFAHAQSQHWTRMPLSYAIINETLCGTSEAKRIRRAFAVLENDTRSAVAFIETPANESADILMACHRGFNASRVNADGTIVTAESSWNTQRNRIINARVDFYDTKEGKVASNCAYYSDTEIHEILHAFGFEHTTERYHIMNHVQSYCPTKLNADIVERLRAIYAPPA